MKKLPLICSIVMLVSFFLPYVTFMGFGASGLKTATAGGSSAVLFLIPLGAIAAIVFAAMNHGLSKIFTMVAGVIPILLGLYAMMKMSGAPIPVSLFSIAGIGLWLTLLSAIGCIVSFFIAFKD